MRGKAQLCFGIAEMIVICLDRGEGRRIALWTLDLYTKSSRMMNSMISRMAARSEYAAAEWLRAASMLQHEMSLSEVDTYVRS